MSEIPKRLRAGSMSAVLAGALSAVLLMEPRVANAEESVDFAVPPWPGVTVKTEVARQILESMGYETRTTELTAEFAYTGIRSGDVDVFLASWMPAHTNMLQPLLDDDAAVQHAANLEGAVQGLTVPAYVCEEGIETVEDMVAHGERFGREIFALEPSAGMTIAFDKAVEENYKGLGDWNVVSSSEGGMLSQVARAIRRNDAIVFHGWAPHWMAVEWDLCFLDDDQGSEIAASDSTVHTIVRPGWLEENPRIARFLEQFQVSVDAQSAWIYEFGHRDRPEDEVASEWIAGNLDLVESWLDGVEAADGRPGIEAVRSRHEDG